jgi:hypothetical protein
MDYHIVSQGKTTIPSVDDNEEMELTDVRTQIGLHYFTLSCFTNKNKLFMLI